jgi:protein SCO1/2
MLVLRLLALLLLLDGAAVAGVNNAALDAVYVEPKPGAAPPMNLEFRDEAGQAWSLATALQDRPAVLVFADYTCHTLCGPVLDFTIAALQQTGLQPGSAYRLVVVGLDPKDGLEAAGALKSSHLANDDAIRRAALFLTGTPATIEQTTTALGYHFAYDAEHDQFAHPASAFVLNGSGEVTRVLSGLGLSGADLRLALVEAGRGQVGALADRFRLLCYGYDPARGIYTARIGLLLQITAALTLAAMAGGLLVLHRMARAQS